MTLVYSHENMINVSNIRNLLENEGIETELRNEYASSAAGDLSPIETWPQIWLIYEEDKLKADRIVEGANNQSLGEDWICNHCLETNAASFDFCWNCQHDCK